MLDVKTAEQLYFAVWVRSSAQAPLILNVPLVRLTHALSRSSASFSSDGSQTSSLLDSCLTWNLEQSEHFIIIVVHCCTSSKVAIQLLDRCATGQSTHVCWSVRRQELFIVYTYLFTSSLLSQFHSDPDSNESQSQSSVISISRQSVSQSRFNGRYRRRGSLPVDPRFLTLPWACSNYRTKLGTTL